MNLTIPQTQPTPRLWCSILTAGLLAAMVSAAPAQTVFDFGDGTSSVNNSQNGGLGNVTGVEDSATTIHTPTLDGITLTLVATNITSAATVTLGVNNQGWGVRTAGESGTAIASRRIGGDVGIEAFEFSLDTAVELDSLRFGSLGSGEVVTLEFVSGTNPFTSGTSLTITGTGSQGPDYDIVLATDPVVTGGLGIIEAGTVLRLRTSTPAGSGVLLNELTVSDPSGPPTVLITSIAPGFPSNPLAGNPGPGSDPGQTAVTAGASKGQSFSLPASASLSNFVVRVDSVTTTGNFTLDIYRAMDGLPWLLVPVYSEAGTLPPGLTNGVLLQIELPVPLDVVRGSYTVALTGLDATEFTLGYSGDPLYSPGAAARNDAATNGWEPLGNPDADLIFAVVGTQAPVGPGAPANAPNIVFIMSDDLGWTDIQTGGNGPNVLNGVNYGSDYYQTPNLSRLAAEGLSFTDCFAHPNCSPTRAAILSGQYSARSGNGVYVVGSLNRPAGSEQPTAFIPPAQREDIPASHIISAEVLQAGGYVTAHFGKYHVGNKQGGLATMPENQGYDFNFGGDDSGAPGAYHASGQQFGSSMGPGLDAYAKLYASPYVSTILLPIANSNDPTSLVGSEKHVEDGLGDAAIAFMNDHRRGPLSGRPFYLQLHDYAVHSPTGDSQARADLLTKYKNLPLGTRHTVASYAAIVENMDQTVGRVLNYLDDPNGDGDVSDSIATNTLVIFTSDNGGHIGPTDNDPLRHRKGSFYNGGIRVPLIVRQPGTVPAGVQTDTLVHSVDFYPTLVEVAGLTLPDGIHFDGTSFAAHLRNPDVNLRDRESVFYHFPGYLDQRARPCEVVLKRVGGEAYKLMYTYDLNYTGNPSSAEDVAEGLDVLSNPWELYCYSDDISETTNLLDGSYSNWLLYGDLATTLANELSAWLNQPGPDWDARKVVNAATSTEVPYPDASSLPAVTPPVGAEFRIRNVLPDFQARQATLTFNSEAGFLYDIEGASDLAGWEPLLTDIRAVGPQTTRVVDDAALGNGAPAQRFYRVVLHK